MKLKKYFPLLLLIIIQLFTTILLWRPGMYLAHDSTNQVARIGAYYKTFSDFNLPPRWAGDLNYGYGSPVFDFFYPLPGYLGSLFHALGMSLENSFKLIAGLGFIFAPLTFYFWFCNKFNKYVSFIAALFYGLAPYHFLDLYVRGDLGEILGFVFIPLVFLFIDQIIEHPAADKIVFGGISFALLILAHNGLALIFTPVILLYALLFSKNNDEFINLVRLFILGFGISAFFWLPALYDARFTNFYFFNNGLFKLHFPSLRQLLYSPWGFGPDVNMPGGLSPQIGPLHIFFVMLAMMFTLLGKRRERQLIFWLIIFAGAFFLSTNYSLAVWETVKPLRQLEFPWRFTALSGFTASVLAGLVIARLNNKLVNAATIILLMLLTSPLMKTGQLVYLNDKYYLSFPGTTTYHSETSTVWAGSDASTYPGKPVEVIGGKAIVTGDTKSNDSHSFIIHSQSTSKILDNTLYFPGWRVKMDGQNVPVEFQDPNHKGLITFSVPAGFHKVEVSFHETPLRLIADLISLITVFLALLELFRANHITKLWTKKLSP